MKIQLMRTQLSFIPFTGFEVDYAPKLNHVSIFAFYIAGILNSSYISLHVKEYYLQSSKIL